MSPTKKVPTLTDPILFYFQEAYRRTPNGTLVDVWYWYGVENSEQRDRYRETELPGSSSTDKTKKIEIQGNDGSWIEVGRYNEYTRNDKFGSVRASFQLKIDKKSAAKFGITIEERERDDRDKVD